MLTNEDIMILRNRAGALAEVICFAWVYDTNKEEGRKAQAELADIIDLFKREGIIYNGKHDIWLTKKI
jgi:hypothetical protein